VLGWSAGALLPPKTMKTMTIVMLETPFALLASKSENRV